jgi:uncharacterized protein YndB with AHSA1/START domain
METRTAADGPDLPPLEAVRRELVLDAPPREVWDEISRPGALGGWLADEVDVEVRTGAFGTVRDEGGPVRPVAVEEVVPGRRIGLVWRDVGDRPTLVEIALEPEGPAAARTRVVVVEVPVATLRLVAPAATRVLAGSSAAGGGPAARALAGVR